MRTAMIAISLSAVVLAMPAALPASAQQIPLNACGTGQAAGSAMSKEKHEIIVRFERYVGKAADGTEQYYATFITAPPDGATWYLFEGDRPAAGMAAKDAQVCVAEKGQRFEIRDHKSYKAAFENGVELTINGKTDLYRQGAIHWFTREAARKEWDKLEAMGGQGSERDNPNYTDLMGYRFDYRKADAACEVAKKRWNVDFCARYEKQEFEMADLIGAYIVLNAASEHENKADSYILSIAIETDVKDAKVWMLYTSLDGATVIRQTGKNFSFTGWAADDTPSHE